MATEATATGAPQHASVAQFNKLAAYVTEMAKQFNALEARVIELERREEAEETTRTNSRA
jgi:hypothetical protein